MVDDNNGGAGANNGMEELDESKLPKFSEIDENNATPEEVKALKESAQTLLGKTKHWSGKSKKLETELDELKKNNKPAAPAPGAADDELRGTVKRLEIVEEKRQFGPKHSLTPEETDNLFAFATGMGLKPTEAMDHPFFKSGIEALRQNNKTANATPGPSGRAPIVEGKTFGELSKDEKNKNWGKIVDTAQKSKGR